MKKLLFLIILLTLSIYLYSKYEEDIKFLMIDKLIVSDTIERADCIVALGGESSRKKEAVKLFREGYAKKILFTGFEITKEDYERYGLKPHDYIYPVKSAFNTYEESQVVLGIIKKYNFKSIILVTSFYHSRRASETFKRFLGKENIKVMVYPVFWQNFDIRNWHKNSYLKKAVIIEWLGLLYYKIEYF
ncbi:MAG: YdcF family protein [Proteobacteria bacterium]|nr:YdcF family protein [Pseudomonadota bacterium]